jgi:type I restriction enzyme S subunit
LSGFAFKSELFNENDGIPLIRIRDLQKRKFTEVGYTGDYEERYLVNSGDFLIGMDGGFRCYEWLGPKALLNQRVCRIQSFDKSEVVPRFVFFLVNQYLEKIEESTSFTTVKHISVKQVKDIRFPLPPIAEQKRIVDVVSSVDAYIDALQHQVDAARTARNAVLHELLTAGGDDWTESTPNVKRFEHVAFLKRGHDLPSQSRLEGDYPVVASNGSVGYHNECIGPIPGLVTGRSGTIGKVMYLETGYWPLNTTLYVTDFMGNDERFVALTLETMRLGRFAGGTTVPSLDRKVFRGELVFAPPLSEQQRIVEIVSSMDDVIQAAERAVVEAKSLRSGLLSDLLSGEHEIPVSYDELLGAA